MTTTAEHCIAAIGLNTYLHERSWRDQIYRYFTTTSTPVCII